MADSPSFRRLRRRVMRTCRRMLRRRWPACVWSGFFAAYAVVSIALLAGHGKVLASILWAAMIALCAMIVGWTVGRPRSQPPSRCLTCERPWDDHSSKQHLECAERAQREAIQAAMLPPPADAVHLHLHCPRCSVEVAFALRAPCPQCLGALEVARGG